MSTVLHAPRSTSLDPKHLNVENDLHADPGQEFRFRHAEHERALWLKILPAIEIDHRRITRFEACGSDAWIQFSKARNRYRVASNRCKLRICPACRLAYARRTAEKLRWSLRRMQPNSHKFITLTMRHAAAPLAIQLANLRSAFRRLRQRKIWKHNVIGGYAVIEITFNRSAREWHPHLHVLAKAKFIDQRALSKAWCSASRGSYIVDVRTVTDSEKATRYLTGYLGKPPEPQTYDDQEARLREYYTALDRSRLLIHFGANDDDAHFTRPDDELPNDWITVASFAAIQQAADHHNPTAENILNALKGDPDDADLPQHPHPP